MLSRSGPECRTRARKRGHQPKKKLIVETTEMGVIQGENKEAEKTKDKTMGTFAYKGQIQVGKK